MSHENYIKLRAQQRAALDLLVELKDSFPINRRLRVGQRRQLVMCCGRTRATMKCPRRARRADDSQFGDIELPLARRQALGRDDLRKLSSNGRGQLP